MRLCRFVVALPLCASIALPCAAQSAPASKPIRLQRAYERMDEFVAQQMLLSGTPGLALALTSREGLLRVQTYGFADVKSRLPVATETLFEIGSISKSFTAIALLQLREQSKFDPQQPITKYLPWFQVPSKFAPVTGHHLLSHTSGIPRDRDVIPSSLFQVAGLRELWTGYAPGARYAYSNIGFQILGYTLEELTQQDYGDVIRKRIFEPVGMSSSLPFFTHADRPRIATGYETLYDDRPSHRSHPLVEAPWLEYAAGDGSIAATPADLAAYLRMLLNRGITARGRVISEESFNLLTQRAIQTDREGKCWYGYGMGTYEEEGHIFIAHGGGMVGYSSMLLGDITAGLGVVVFVNGPGNPGRLADFALKCLRAALQNKDLPAMPAPDPPTRVKNAADYAGTYAAPDGRKLNLVAGSETLVLEHAGQKIVLERRGPDSFFVNHPDFALFLLRFAREQKKTDAKESKPPEPGKVLEAIHGGDWYAGENYTGEKNFKPPKDWLAYPGHYRTQHMWFNNFRVILRKGQLYFAMPGGGEEELVELSPGLFQIGTEETAERIRFDTLVNARALRASVSGSDYYRVFTP